MKLKLFFPLMLVGVLSFAGCNDDNDHIQVSPEVDEAFYAMYPDASNVDWEREGNYFVADFWRNDMNTDAEAWFDGAGRWQMTITEIAYEQLPQPVRTSFEGSEYAAWRVEDVDLVERSGREAVYVLDIEQGEQELDLYYTADGVLIKAVDDNGSNSSSDYLPGDISSSITEFVMNKYPNAKIIETERDAQQIEVDILDGGVHREVVFTVDGNWKYTKTEMRKADLPETVAGAFDQSQYASYMVEEIDWYNTPDGDFYIFELESEPEDIHIKIGMDGSIEQVTGAIF